jgi:hypothetical protein
VLQVLPAYNKAYNKKEQGSQMSNSTKWVFVAALAIVAVLIGVVAIEYFTVPFRDLPSFIPGRHQAFGTYHKRGAVAGLVAVVIGAVALVMAVRIRRAGGDVKTERAEEVPAVPEATSPSSETVPAETVGE